MIVEPPVGEPTRFAVLYVPPAGDEMNKSRRMAMLQAQALARRGAAVVLLDLYGTGDSAGNHGDANWDGWRGDVRYAWEWLCRSITPPKVLWGARLGGLLAADLVAHQVISPAVLLLWQPVLSGRTFFNQWLRLASAGQLARHEDEKPAPSLRKVLDSGRRVEVGGYELNPALVAAVDAIDLAALNPRSSRVVWREMTVADPPALSPGADAVKRAWVNLGASADIASLNGASFWASQEIVEVPVLVTDTTRVIGQLLFPETPS